MWLLNDKCFVMKLVKILKYTLYAFMSLYLLMTIINPIAMYGPLGGFGSQAYANLISYGSLTGVAGTIICFNGARVLKSFEENSFSFEVMSNSFKWIGLCLLIALLVHSILYTYLSDAQDEEFFINMFDTTLVLSISGFFFLAISQIIKKADYYKTQNDLTI